MARPLPVEYLLVDLPAAFPVEAAYTFYADPAKRPFAIEHREDIGENQVSSAVDIFHLQFLFQSNTSCDIQQHSQHDHCYPNFCRTFCAVGASGLQ